jgi:hypothetical protein
VTFIRTANTEEQRESTCSSNVGVRRLRRSVTATNSRRDGRRVCARMELTAEPTRFCAPFLGCVEENQLQKSTCNGKQTTSQHTAHHGGRGGLGTEG